MVLDFSFAVVFVLGLVALTSEQRESWADDIRKALKTAQLTLTEAADIMRLHKSDLCNALAGLQKLDDWRLAMLPPEFHRWLALYKLRRFGVPDLVHTALKATPTLLDLKKED